ncbi:hypothetical protein OY671_012263, partial [Metschnikowia pulcherrima]
YGMFGSASPPAVQAYVASRTGPDERTQASSSVASSFGSGTVSGPASAPSSIVPGSGSIGPFAAFSVFASLVSVTSRSRSPDDDPRFAGRGEVMAAPFSASSNPRMVEDHPDGSPEESPEAEPQHAGGDRSRWSDPRSRGWLAAGVSGGHAQS